MIRELAFVVPGALTTLTGGYRYDDRILSALRVLGWKVSIHELSGAYPRPENGARNAAARVLQELPDGMLVVIDGLALGALPTLVAHHQERLRIVALVHHPLSLETGLDAATAAQLEASEQAALQATHGVIVTSQATASLLPPYGVPASLVRVVEPGTDEPDRGRAVEPSKANRPVSLLCVASLINRKGHTVLIEALAPWRELDWSLICIGSKTREPALLAQLENQLRALRLTEHVMLAGELSDQAVKQHYCQADAFVMASEFEGYGMVFDEAVAYGLPVIATRVGAVESAVPPAARALVPPGHVAALAAALGRFIRDQPYRDALTQAASAGSVQRRTWAQAGTDFGRALEALAA